MELEYTLLYENNEHDGYCTDDECTYEAKEITRTVHIPTKYLLNLWVLFCMYRKHLPMDVINIILRLRLEMLDYHFKKIDYKGKHITVKLNEADLYTKYFFTMYFINHQFKPKSILGKKPRGYEYPSYYCGSGWGWSRLSRHEHCITITKMKMNQLS